MATKNVTKIKNTEMEKSSGGTVFPLSLSSFEDIERMFDQYFNSKWFNLPRLEKTHDLWGTYEMHSPRMDMIDKDDEILIRVELPGVDKKDLDVSVVDNILTIKGTSSFESKEKKDAYYKSEIKKVT